MPFGDFLYDSLKEYRASLNGSPINEKMWIEHVERAHSAWHAFRKPKKKPRPASGFPSEAERIYAHYPRKVGKEAALKAIMKALTHVPAAMLESRIKAFAECASRYTTKDRVFIPHPATWFNQGRYDDDPKEWLRPNMKPRALDVPEPMAAIPEPVGWRAFIEGMEDDPDRLGMWLRGEWGTIMPFYQKRILAKMAGAKQAATQ